MVIPYGKIEAVSLSRTVDESWQKAFKVAQAQAQPLVGMEARQYCLFGRQDDLLKLALHQVYKQHWDSKHKFPCRLEKLERQGIEIYGNFWYEKLKLCKHLHSSSFGESYLNAAQWFMVLVLEYRQIKAKSIKAKSSSNEGKNSSNEGKKSLADLITQNLKALRNDENPYDSDLEPHWARLIDAAISSAKLSNQFRRHHWNPFLRAYAAWRDDLRKNPSWYAVIRDENGKYYNQGVGRLKIPSFRES